jgi:hypothetical protein
MWLAGVLSWKFLTQMLSHPEASATNFVDSTQKVGSGYDMLQPGLSQISSAGSSSETSYSGFRLPASAWRRVLRVFLYHHAVARPAARADAAATIPNLNQPETWRERPSDSRETIDSKSPVMILMPSISG